MTGTATGRRAAGGRAGRKAGRVGGVAAVRGAVAPGMVGGQYRPLSDSDVQRIHRTALDVLEKTGIGSPPPSCVDLVTAAGGWLNDAGRLCFPGALVEDVIAKACRGFVLHGQNDDRSLEISGKRVHFGTAGAPVSIVDFHSGEYRRSRLVDLYDIARLVDTLEHVHFMLRPIGPTDILGSRLQELNTAYACLSGTTKPISMSFTHSETVDETVALFDMVLGGEGRFRNRPFCFAANCFIVPPLRFSAEACACLEAQVRLGMPVNLQAVSQAGATAPAALAGTVTQAVAECLAGLVYVNLLSPGHPALLGTWPFVSDLRTGALSSGSGEQGVLAAACTQMINFYDLPSCVAAGMSDSKIPDAQSGFEKGYTTALAGLAGCNMVHGAAGMQASIMGVSFESYVIDDEMLGAVLRAVRGVEVTGETLSAQVMDDVVRGSGHYLNHPQTLALMQSEFLYPRLADRLNLDQWKAGGSRDIRARARDKAAEVLAVHYPGHIDSALDEGIREGFNIQLSREHMAPGNGRW